MNHLKFPLSEEKICSLSFKRANHGSIEIYPLEKIIINSWALATTNTSTGCVSLRGLSDKDQIIWSCIAQQLDASTPEPFLHGYVAFSNIKYLEQSIYLCCKIMVWKKIRRTNSINLHAHMKLLVPQISQRPKTRRITLKISLLCGLD